MGSKTRTTRTVGDAPRNGSRSLRERALEVGRMSADMAAQAAQAAEQRLNVGTENARKELARKAARTRKDAVRSAQEARALAEQRREELRVPGRKAKKAAIKAAKSAGLSRRKAKREFKKARKEFKAAMAEAKAISKQNAPKRTKRWPWLLGFAAFAGAVAYAMKSRQEEPSIAPVPPRSTDIPTPATTATTASGATKAGASENPKRQSAGSDVKPAQAKTRSDAKTTQPKTESGTQAAQTKSRPS